LFKFKDNSDSFSLLISGYLNGAPLNVNGLVHISGCGDFQLSQVVFENDPNPLKQFKVLFKQFYLIFKYLEGRINGNTQSY